MDIIDLVISFFNLNKLNIYKGLLSYLVSHN